MRLDGRTALVTGGTQGVGAAIAKSIAKAGGNLILHGLREDGLALETIDACRRAGATVQTAYCDLATDTEAAVAYLLEQCNQHARI